MGVQVSKIRTVVDRGVVNQDPIEIEVGRVARIQHRACNVWDVLSCVTFASNIDLLGLAEVHLSENLGVFESD